METKIPIAKVRAKPRIGPVPKLKRIAQVIKEETLESRIDDQALSNPEQVRFAVFLTPAFFLFHSFKNQDVGINRHAD